MQYVSVVLSRICVDVSDENEYYHSKRCEQYIESRVSTVRYILERHHIVQCTYDESTWENNDEVSSHSTKTISLHELESAIYKHEPGIEERIYEICRSIAKSEHYDRNTKIFEYVEDSTPIKLHLRDG